jgi:hypothetical protein
MSPRSFQQLLIYMITYGIYQTASLSHNVNCLTVKKWPVRMAFFTANRRSRYNHESLDSRVGICEIIFGAQT